MDRIDHYIHGTELKKRWKVIMTMTSTMTIRSVGVDESRGCVNAIAINGFDISSCKYRMVG